MKELYDVIAGSVSVFSRSNEERYMPRVNFVDTQDRMNLQGA